MDQQSDPSTINQVIIIVEGAKEQVKFKKAYNVKAATVLGIVHVMCGFIALGASIAVIDKAYEGGLKYTIPGDFGIFASLLFLLSGVLTISGARFGRKCLVVASMVTAIISAIAGGILLILSAFLSHHIYRKYYRRYYKTPYYPKQQQHQQQHYELAVSYGLLVAMGATMLIIAIASASFTCLPLCCRPKKQGIVHYKPNQVPDNVLCLCQIIVFVFVTLPPPDACQRHHQQGPDRSAQSHKCSESFATGSGNLMISKRNKKLSFQPLSDATEPPVGFTNPLASNEMGSLPAEPPAYQHVVPGEGSNYQKF